MKRVLNEHTLVPISLIFVFLGVIFWVGSFYNESMASIKKVERVEESVQTIKDNVIEMKQDIKYLKEKADKK